MDDKLLVRVYDVGFGDCIYVRIPDGQGYYHLLVDCGTSASADPQNNPALKNAVDDVRSMLPQVEAPHPGASHPGPMKRRLDLLVATHPHADHIKGFDPTWFEDVQIERIWLTVFIKPDHPQAKKMMAFQDVANDAARSLEARQGLHLAPGVQALLQRSIWNPGALKALREGLAQASGISPRYPLYVARDLADRLTPAQQEDYDLDFDGGTTRFRGFQDAGTCLRVLAPEWDIDKYYLGKDTLGSHGLTDQVLRLTEAYQAVSGAFDAPTTTAASEPAPKPAQPKNISDGDFRLLQNRLLYSALAFSQTDDALKNNTSIVLLLEWRGRRLLFTGDAEWHGPGFKEGQRNGTWDVMLHQPEVEQMLLQPLDLLKVSHHGSHNGTPFLEGGKERVLAKMLDPERTQILVSTVAGEHGITNPVPFPPLLAELGRLAKNRRRYANDEVVEMRAVDQPQRTDLESSVVGKAVRYVEVELEPDDG